MPFVIHLTDIINKHRQLQTENRNSASTEKKIQVVLASSGVIKGCQIRKVKEIWLAEFEVMFDKRAGVFYRSIKSRGEPAA